MFHSHPAQIGRCQMSRFVKKNSQCYRSPIDRPDKGHCISLNGGGFDCYDSSGSHSSGVKTLTLTNLHLTGVGQAPRRRLLTLLRIEH